MVYSQRYRRTQLLRFTLVVPILMGALMLLAFVHPYYSALRVQPTLKTRPIELKKTVRKPVEKPVNTSNTVAQPTNVALLAAQTRTPIDSPQVPKPVLSSRDKAILNSTAYFRYKEDQLGNEAVYQFLKEVVTVLKAHPRVKLLVAGHTANWGDQETDYQALSERRAQAVKAYLFQQGIAKGRLITKGFGSTQPAAQNDSEFGKIKNNRVTFVILKDK